MKIDFYVGDQKIGEGESVEIKPSLNWLFDLPNGYIITQENNYLPPHSGKMKVTKTELPDGTISVTLTPLPF